LGKLEQVDFSDNEVEDISALGSIGGLEELICNGNQVRDISALMPLWQLKLISLRDNPLSEEARTVHVPELRKRGAVVVF